MPNNQKTKWPNDFVYIFWLAESSPFLHLKYMTEKPNDPVTFLFPIQLEIIVWQTKNQVTQWPYTLFPDMLTSWLFKQWPNAPNDLMTKLVICQSTSINKVKWPKKPNDHRNPVTLLKTCKVTILLQTKQNV